MTKSIKAFNNGRYSGWHRKKLSTHEKKCQEIFNHVKEGQQIYVRVEWPRKDNGSENTMEKECISEDNIKLEKIVDEELYFRVSILTDEILEYDTQMFNVEDREALLDKYRPYFISFIVSLEENSLRDIENIGDNWHLGQFVRTEALKYSKDEGVLLNGILETSASPVNYLDGRLLVFNNRALPKKVLDKINSTYDPSLFVKTSNSKVENILKDAWKTDFPETIDIYNIGHGNADYIRGSKHRILFDIGYNYRSFPKSKNARYLRAVNAIRCLKPSCVILSHWDLDHIIGCAYAKQDIFKVKWIAPYLTSKNDTKVTTNAVRLAHYLKTLGNLNLIDRDQKNSLIAIIPCGQNVNLKLWLGIGTSRLTPINREGLIVEIIDEKGNHPHVLLAGDVPYKCMPDILKGPIDFMHVPHHCSNMELARLDETSSIGVCAIVSTNRKQNGRLNYDQAHCSKLCNRFSNVVTTIDNPSGNDEANLSVQVNYRKKDHRFR